MKLQLQSFKNLQTAPENKKKSFGAELAVFPQHGIFYTHSAQLMKEAAAMGVYYTGGFDPTPWVFKKDH